MEKVVTQTNGDSIMVGTTGVNNPVKLSVISNGYMSNKRTITLSRRQVKKLIAKLQEIVDNKQPIPKDFNPDNYIK